jgi:hypothetical protein
VSFDHRQPLDPVIFHLVQHLTDVGGGVDPEQRALGQITRPYLGRVAALGDAPHRDAPVGEGVIVNGSSDARHTAVAFGVPD